MTRERVLDGYGVLVTRPQHQSQGLLQAIEAAGGTALALPTIEIVPQQDSRRRVEGLRADTRFDGIVFISPNAVIHGLPLLRSADLLEASAAIAAVGAATAQALESAGQQVTIVPRHGADSEALLAHPDLQQVVGKRFLIVRGEGGRELLMETLSARGAQVQYAEVYHRALPETGQEALRQWLQGNAIQIVTVTSVTGLKNLVELAGGELAPTLCELPLVVVSERMLQLAERLGFVGPVRVAAGASDSAVTEAVLDLWVSHY